MVWIQVRGSMGDELGLTGALREYKRQHPDEMVRIWGKHNHEIFGGLPYLNIGNRESGQMLDVYSFEPTHVGTRTELNCKLLKLDLSRIEDPYPEFAWTAEELARPILVKKTRSEKETVVQPIEEIIPPDAGPIIAIDPKAGWPSREWPHERFEQLSLELSARGHYVVQCGAQGVRPLPGTKANLAGRLALRDLARWLGRCKLFVGNDSGLFHISAAVGTPQVIIYGITRRTCGPYPSTIAVAPRTECAGCFLTCKRKGPDRKISHCMAEISVGEVLDAIDLALSRPRPANRLVPSPTRGEIYRKFMAAAAATSGA